MRTPNDLMPWQKSATNRLIEEQRGTWDKGFAIAADPGAGKTTVVLHALMALRSQGASVARKALLVGPRAVLDTVWAREAAAWEYTAPLSFELTHQVVAQDRFNRIRLSSANVVTLTKDQFADWVADCVRGGACPVSMLIVDEAHAFVNAGSRRSKALTALGGHLPIWMISGTLLPNGPINSWAVGRCVLGNKAAFCADDYETWRAQNFYEAGYNWKPMRKTFGDQAATAIAQRGLAIRLDTSNDTRRVVYQTIGYTMPDALRHQYDRAQVDLQILVAPGVYETFHENAMLEKCRQLTQGIIIHRGETVVIDRRRMDVLHEILTGIDGSVLVPVRYRSEASELRRFLEQYRYRVELLTGSTSAADRPRIVDAWNAGQYDVLLCSPEAMAEGLNLHLGGAHHIVWYTLGWSFKDWTQLNARLARTGQKRVVSVTRIVCEKSTDRFMIDVVNRKLEYDTEVKALWAEWQKGTMGRMTGGANDE